MKILFVCTGNTCRSPMACGLFVKLLKEKSNFDISCDSAGIFCNKGDLPAENAVLACLEKGIDLKEHRAKSLYSLKKDQIDFFAVMTKQHKILLKELNIPADKIYVLGEEIADPYGKNLEEYRFCRDQIAKALSDFYFYIKKDNK